MSSKYITHVGLVINSLGICNVSSVDKHRRETGKGKNNQLLPRMPIKIKKNIIMSWTSSRIRTLPIVHARRWSLCYMSFY